MINDQHHRCFGVDVSYEYFWTPLLVTDVSPFLVWMYFEYKADVIATMVHNVLHEVFVIF